MNNFEASTICFPGLRWRHLINNFESFVGQPSFSAIVWAFSFACSVWAQGFKAVPLNDIALANRPF
jgi:hypothetical protein